MDDLAKLSAAAPQGAWSYRPGEYDDWGIVRGEIETEWGTKIRPVIAQFRGVNDQKGLQQHRIDGTDPYGPSAIFIVTLVNAYRSGELVPASELAELREKVARLEGENARLRQSIADNANRINIVGSPYDQAMKALAALVMETKAQARAALGGDQ